MRGKCAYAGKLACRNLENIRVERICFETFRGKPTHVRHEDATNPFRHAPLWLPWILLGVAEKQPAESSNHEIAKQQIIVGKTSAYKSSPTGAEGHPVALLDDVVDVRRGARGRKILARRNEVENARSEEKPFDKCVPVRLGTSLVFTQ